MRRFPILAMLAIVPALGWGVPAFGGLLGGGPPTRIPSPARAFSAVVEDVGGTTVRITSASWDGEVHVWGDLGAAEISIPFENVVEVRVLPAGEPHRRVISVATRHAEPVELLVDKDVPIFGKTAYGNYRIELGDVRRMTVTATAAAE